MMVIVTQAIPDRLRGYLARYLVEVRAGVFVGNYSARTRATIWETVLDEVEFGNAVLIWQTNTESGFDFKTVGKHRRIPTEKDGLKVVDFTSEEMEKNWYENFDRELD
ncbi:MAG: type I-E CRISPR-associated endoribonuclease Cas2e [Candidatus Acetothermia bacterium]